MKITRSITAAVLALVLVAGSELEAQAAPTDVTITGVVTVSGVPRAGVPVGWTTQPLGYFGSTTTDATGAYSITMSNQNVVDFIMFAGAVKSGTHEWYPVDPANGYLPKFTGLTASDYLYQNLESFPVAGGNRVVDFALDLPGSIETSDPSFARGSFNLKNLGGDILTTVLADASGVVRFGSLIPGSYQVEQDRYGIDADARDPAASNAPWVSPTISVSSSATSTVVPTFVPTGTIAGVILVRGKPVKGLGVAASSDLASSMDYTNSRGEYVLTGLTAGSYRVELGSFAKKSLTVVPRTETALVTAGATTTVNTSLKAGGTISGTVGPNGSKYLEVTVLSTTGKVLATASVPVKSKNVSTKFTVTGVQAGRALVYVSSSGKKRTYAKTTVTVKAARTTKVGSLTLSRRSITLSGKTIGNSIGSVTTETPGSSLNFGYSDVKNSRYTITGVIPSPGTTLRFSAAGRQDNVVKLGSPRRGKKNIKVGARFGHVRLTLVAGLYPVEMVVGEVMSPKTGERLGTFRADADDRSLYGAEIIPGTAVLALGEANSDFVKGSPFWVSLPDRPPFTVVRSKTVQLGTVPLTIHR